MTVKRNALGKGLSALLENVETDVTSKSTEQTAHIVGSIPLINLDQIETNPFQPRTEFDEQALEELSASIKELGLIQPITVRKLGYDKYQIISGERRVRASRLAGLKSVPAYIRVANDQGMLEMALVENIQRADLNAIEVGVSYQRLIEECKLTQEELSDRVGKNRTTVTNYIRLLKLPPEIQAALRDNKISMGHARALLSITDLVNQLDAFRHIVEKGLSVREVEELARQESGIKATERFRKSLSPEMAKIESVLSSHFGTKIHLSRKNDGSGKIVIPYEDDSDLNRILEMLNY